MSPMDSKCLSTLKMMPLPSGCLLQIYIFEAFMSPRATETICQYFDSSCRLSSLLCENLREFSLHRSLTCSS